MGVIKESLVWEDAYIMTRVNLAVQDPKESKANQLQTYSCPSFLKARNQEERLINIPGVLQRKQPSINSDSEKFCKEILITFFSLPNFLLCKGKSRT